MLTASCQHCGQRLQLKRKRVWTFDVFHGKCIKAPVGPYPNQAQRREILLAHEHHCQRRKIREHYGGDAPLQMWVNTRTPVRND